MSLAIPESVRKFAVVRVIHVTTEATITRVAVRKISVATIVEDALELLLFILLLNAYPLCIVCVLNNNTQDIPKYKYY